MSFFLLFLQLISIGNWNLYVTDKTGKFFLATRSDTFYFRYFTEDFISFYKGGKLLFWSIDSLHVENYRSVKNVHRFTYEIAGYKFKATYNFYGDSLEIRLSIPHELGLNYIFFPPMFESEKDTLYLPSGVGTAIYPGMNFERRMDYPSMTVSWSVPLYVIKGKRAGLIVRVLTPYDLSVGVGAQGRRVFIGEKWKYSIEDVPYRIIRIYMVDSFSFRELLLSFEGWYGEKLNTVRRELLGIVEVPLEICFKDVRRVKIYKEKQTPFVSYIEKIRRLKALGLKRALFHIDGWGRDGYDHLHPFPLPPCPEAGGYDGISKLSEVIDSLGYLMELHDNYRDFYLDSPVFDSSLAIVNRKGEIPVFVRWAGGPQTLLCPKVGINFLRAVLDSLEKHGVIFKAHYLDAFSGALLFECYSKEHPLSRRDCAYYMKKMLAYIKETGRIVGSEDVSLWGAEVVDHVYKLRRAEIGVDIPLIPLFFHSHLVMPYDVGDLRDRKRLLEALLFGSPPLTDLNSLQLAYLKEDPFNPVKILQTFHLKYGKLRITDILNPGDTLGVVYENGDTIMVDFKEGRYAVNSKWFKMPILPLKIDVKIVNFKKSGQFYIKFTPYERLKEDFKIFLHIVKDGEILVNLDHYPDVSTSGWELGKTYIEGPFDLKNRLREGGPYAIEWGIFSRDAGRFPLVVEGKITSTLKLGKIWVRGGKFFYEE